MYQMLIGSSKMSVLVLGFSLERKILAWARKTHLRGFSPERGLARLSEEGSTERVKSWAILEDSRLSDGNFDNFRDSGFWTTVGDKFCSIRLKNVILSSVTRNRIPIAPLAS
ncbi:hypothetical protein Lal_00036322 [Lupinus albus]|nr:hypothetical protein Lal_00036322 [Lupinus albus]